MDTYLLTSDLRDQQRRCAAALLPYFKIQSGDAKLLANLYLIGVGQDIPVRLKNLRIEI